MATLAIALLRLPNLDPQTKRDGAAAARVVKLEDAVLLHTNVDFGSEPEAIIEAVRAAAGDDAIDDHEDERGIFVIPAVARPKAKRYDDVIAEVADLGMWIDEDSFDDAPPGAPGIMGLPAGTEAMGGFGGGGGLDALVGQMMGAMGPGGIEELQRAMTSGDPAAMAQVQSMMQAAMAQLGDPEAIARALTSSFDGSDEDEDEDDDDDGDGDAATDDASVEGSQGVRPAVIKPKP